MLLWMAILSRRESEYSESTRTRQETSRQPELWNVRKAQGECVPGLWENQLTLRDSIQQYQGGVVGEFLSFDGGR